MRWRARGGWLFPAAMAYPAVACGLGVVGEAAFSVENPDASGLSDAPVGDGGDQPFVDAGNGEDVANRDDGAADADAEAPAVLIEIASDQIIRAVTVDGESLYYVNDTTKQVIRAGRDGGGGDVFYNGDVRQLAVRGGTMIFTPGARRQVGNGGSSIGSFDSTIGCVSIDDAGEWAYIADFANNRVLRATVSGAFSASEFKVSSDGIASPWGVAASATELFVTLSGGAPGEIRSLPLDGSAVASTLARDQENPNCIVRDEEGRLYWPNNRSGDLVRMQADGGGLTTLARNQGAKDGQTFTQLGIDRDFLYWSSGHRIYRMRR